MPKRQLAGKCAIITGASSGIGRELAIQLAAKKVNMVAAARRIERLESLAQEIKSVGGNCTPLACDVTQPADRQRLFSTCVDSFGGCDIVINCAGIGAMGRFDEADEQRLRKIFEVNFFAAAELMRAALPLLAKSDDGLIVNINSVLGHFAPPLKSEYCATKFALRGLSDSIRSELSAGNIGVLNVCPSTTDSEFFDAAIEDKTGKDWKQRGAMSPATVAQKTISAMERRKREVILSAGGKFFVWLNKIAPGLANKLLSRFGQ